MRLYPNTTPALETSKLSCDLLEAMQDIVVYSLAASVTMAFLDEFHQSFVPSRTPTVRDVALDTTGALFSIVLIRIWVATRVRLSERAS